MKAILEHGKTFAGSSASLIYKKLNIQNVTNNRCKKRTVWE